MEGTSEHSTGTASLADRPQLAAEGHVDKLEGGSVDGGTVLTVENHTSTDVVRSGNALGQPQCIKEGDNIILEVNGEKHTFLQVKPNGKVKVGKNYYSLKVLIGEPFGSCYEASDNAKELVKIDRPPTADWDASVEVAKDNSDLLDAGSENQKLTAEEIFAMRKAGIAGSEIVEALTAGSATFANKTQFSQDKYKRRKAKKYVFYVTATRPCTRSIAEAYYAKSPAKIEHIRVDTLAIMLGAANVHAHAAVLVVETCNGLITGAAAERMGAHGRLCATYFGDKVPSLDAVRLFNFSPESKAVMVRAPLGALLAAAQEGVPPAGTVACDVGGQAVKSSEGCAAMEVEAQGHAVQDALADAAGPASRGDATGSADHDVTEGPSPSSVANAVGATESPEAPAAAAAAAASPDGPAADSTPAASAAVDPGPSSGTPGKSGGAKRKRPGGVGRGSVPGPADQQQPQRGGSVVPLASPEELRSILRGSRGGFTSCLVAAPRAHPRAVMEAVLPLLAPSATFAVFGNYQQPLAECLHALQTERQAVGLALQESFWREYQVLPGRTHPHMQMNSTGGYLLTGTRVLP